VLKATMLKKLKRQRKLGRVSLNPKMREEIERIIKEILSD